MKQIIGAILFIVTLTGCSNPTPSKIAFTSDHDDPSDLEMYVVDSDGTNLTRLTHNPEWDWPINWSPDRQKLVYISGANSDVYVMNVDGTGAELIENGSCGAFTWSSDNKRIFYICDSKSIWSENIEDNTREHLLDLNLAPLDLDWIVIVPDRGKLVYSSTNDDPESGGIYTLNIDGSDLTKIAGPESTIRNVRLSPSGDRLAYVSQKPGNQGIYVINLDGTNLTRLTEDYALAPLWSPDGSKIAFASARSGDNSIYVMDADGSDQKLVVDISSEGEQFAFDWSPDNKQIVFQSSRDDLTPEASMPGAWRQIFVVNIETGKVTRLTNRTGSDVNPVWSH